MERAVCIVAKDMGLGARLPGFRFRLYYTLAMWQLGQVH